MDHEHMQSPDPVLPTAPAWLTAAIITLILGAYLLVSSADYVTEVEIERDTLHERVVSLAMQLDLARSEQAHGCAPVTLAQGDHP